MILLPVMGAQTLNLKDNHRKLVINSWQDGQEPTEAVSLFNAFGVVLRSRASYQECENEDILRSSMTTIWLTGLKKGKLLAAQRKVCHISTTAIGPGCNVAERPDRADIGGAAKRR
jgi:hypothetical protein